MRLVDLTALEAPEGEQTRSRWVVVSEYLDRDPRTSYHGALDEALGAIALRSGATRQGLTLESFNDFGDAYPWPVWLWEAGELLAPERVALEVLVADAGDRYTPGELSLVAGYRFPGNRVHMDVP
ncbi:hypothetical protein [Aeromonas sp. PrichA-15]|uniref:hypothetical protein n=1 Tax=Aeromonas sp. PrichA-15 TaxID=2823360 RepID=UPI001B335D65|nr:hypothetical protein [Aeromonas sp. PrichA-15]MBP4031335.1 hypothetical protein [Aeromonas sp. PrichA-15]